MEKAPGLIWRSGKPIWRASRPAIKAGFKPAWVNLSYFANDEAALVARCYRLTAEANEWLSGRHGHTPVFDGTVGSLINFWQVEPSSPYHDREPATLRPYDTYSRIIIRSVGARRIDALDGRDLKRWHTAWSAPSEPGGRPRLAAARMMFAIIKAALSFGISCRLAGCAELKLIVQQQRFAGPRPRTIAPTATDIEAVRKAAHDQDHASAALAYALQFEGGMRQWDVIGKWVPLSYKAPSSIIEHGKKWIGPMWSQIDQNMILRYTPAKTQFTSGAQVTLDLRECPMVLAELAQGAGRSAPRSADRQPEHRLSVSAEHLLPLVEAGREGRRHPGRALEPRPTGRCRHRGRTGRCQGRRHGQAARPYEQAHHGRSVRPRSARSASPCRSRACRFPRQKRIGNMSAGSPRAVMRTHQQHQGLNAGCDYRRVSRPRRRNALCGARAVVALG